jgi:GT2 family glycosyltransferase
LTGGSATPDLTALIVTWRSRDLLERCLAALDRHAPVGRAMEIVVVDNGSRDGLVEYLLAERPDVRVIANNENVGYTRANNQGLGIARGRDVLLINADAFLTAGAADALLAELDGDPRVGVVGPRLEFDDGSWQRWTAGRAPSLVAAANHYLFLERISPRLAGLYIGIDTRAARTVDWVSSACMVVRAEALRAIGGMDESLFTYMDDVDLCQRLRDRGWLVRYVPQAQVTHLMGGGAGGIASAAALRSFNTYFARRHGRAALVALRAVQIAGFAVRALAYAGAAALRSDRALQTRAVGHWRSLRLVWGARP